MAEVNRTDQGVVTATVGLDEARKYREFWNLFRDRRPELYGPMMALDGKSNRVHRVWKDTFGPLLAGEDVARAILYIVNQPPHVHISDIIVCPTRQEYP